MKLVNLSIAAAAACLFATSAHALKTEDRNLKANGQIEYLKVPGAVNSIGEMFTEGDVYGRIRSNMFLWDWDTSVAGKTEDNDMWGLGGSLVYKTGFYKGFGATAGFYGTTNVRNLDPEPRSRQVFAFHKPDYIFEEAEKAINQAQNHPIFSPRCAMT